jgi:hypothetical protein
MAAANAQGAVIDIRGAAGLLRNAGAGLDVIKAVFKTATSAISWIPALGALVRIDHPPRMGKTWIRAARLKGWSIVPICGAMSMLTGTVTWRGRIGKTVKRCGLGKPWLTEQPPARPDLRVRLLLFRGHSELPFFLAFCFVSFLLHQPLFAESPIEASSLAEPAKMDVALFGSGRLRRAPTASCGPNTRGVEFFQRRILFARRLDRCHGIG